MSPKKSRRPPSAIPTSTSLEDYQALLHPDEFERMLEAIRRPLPQAIRVNTLKISEPDARRTWPRWYGWEVQPVSFCASGWQILEAAERPSHTPEFKLGYFYIQDAASMLPVELFDFTGLEQPLTLDLAAAPGGKSTHLASRSWDRGLLVANDSSHGRIPALRSGLHDWGAMNSVVTSLPGEKFGGWFPNLFDRVLLDAPCSMENLRPAGHPRRFISARERQGLAQRQIRLLDSAFQAVRTGGQLVYSTCTLSPEEDEAVIDALLRMHPGQIQVDDLTGRVPQPAPGLVYHGERDFQPELKHTLRLWPHLYGTSGFFSARLTKTDTRESSPEPGPRYSFEKHNFTRLGRSGQTAFLDRLAELYGLNLSPILEQQHLAIWKRENAYIAIPELFLTHFANLPVEQVGFLFAEENRDGLIPSHELVARFGSDFTRGKWRVSMEQAEVWLRGTDLPLEQEVEKKVGLVVAVEDEWGRLLGRGKILSDRLKNMLPRRLI